MRSSGAQRRHRKQLARIEALPDALRAEKAARTLADWCRKIRVLSVEGGGAAARAFVESDRVLDMACELDPSGRLLSELRRACVDVEAESEAMRARRTVFRD